MKQWGEIQALSRKVSYDDFLALAEKSKEELVEVLRSLEEAVPPTKERIVQMVEVLQEGALWFPGGSKELRVRVCYKFRGLVGIPL